MIKAIKLEKEYLNKIRFAMNYIVVPVYAFLTFSGLLVAAILMEIDETRYSTFFVGILVGVGVLTLALLLSVPVVRKREIALECAKYSFDTSNIDEEQEYDFLLDDNNRIQLTDHGCTQNDEVCLDYGEFDISLQTNKALNLVNINICFSLNKDAKGKEEDEEPWLRLRLSAKLLAAIDKYDIHITNRDVLDYIITNKKEAFKQIYIYGEVKSLSK